MINGFFFSLQKIKMIYNKGRKPECKGRPTNYLEIANFEMSKRHNATTTKCQLA